LRLALSKARIALLTSDPTASTQLIAAASSTALLIDFTRGRLLNVLMWLSPLLRNVTL
jgi:hypothetical protein